MARTKKDRVKHPDSAKPGPSLPPPAVRKYFYLTNSSLISVVVLRFIF